MEETFGATYARSLASDLVLAGGRTAQELLDAGVPAREVWQAVCERTDQPESVRWRHRAQAPRRG